jgi:hypothetical protein
MSEQNIAHASTDEKSLIARLAQLLANLFSESPGTHSVIMREMARRW